MFYEASSLAVPVCTVLLEIYSKQGSHRSPKVLNVLEFDFSIRVPSNVLEFH